MPQATDNQEEKADFFTTAGTLRDGIISLVGSAMYIAETIDMVASLDPVILRYSAWGFGVGCALSVALCAGTAYCHYHVNLNNQSKPADTNPEQDIEAAYESIPTEEPAETEENQEKPSTSLSLLQKAAVAADYCADSMGVAGFFASGINMLTGDKLAKPIKLGVLAGTLFAGGLGSVAEARVSVRSLQMSNSK